MATINGLVVKELHCKNDDCRKLLGYEKIKAGVIAFICPRCKTISIFRINYPKGLEIIDTLSDINTEEKGGEIENGGCIKSTDGSLLGNAGGS
jgi:hypothetical protein